jgi:hypothetical protein
VLLPFDIRPDRLGWSVIEVATDRAASLDGVMLIGLSIEDVEQLDGAVEPLHREHGAP